MASLTHRKWIIVVCCGRVAKQRSKPNARSVMLAKTGIGFWEMPIHSKPYWTENTAGIPTKLDYIYYINLAGCIKQGAWEDNLNIPGILLETALNNVLGKTICTFPVYFLWKIQSHVGQWIFIPRLTQSLRHSSNTNPRKNVLFVMVLPSHDYCSQATEIFTQSTWSRLLIW